MFHQKKPLISLGILSWNCYPFIFEEENCFFPLYKNKHRNIDRGIKYAIIKLKEFVNITPFSNGQAKYDVQRVLIERYKAHDSLHITPAIISCFNQCFPNPLVTLYPRLFEPFKLSISLSTFKTTKPIHFFYPFAVLESSNGFRIIIAVCCCG